MGRSVSGPIAFLVLTPLLAVPVTLAGLVASTRPEPVGIDMSFPAKPSVSDLELVPWDLARVRPGDWVEHDVSSFSRFDTPMRVRTRMACVGVEHSTAWVELTDHLLARFYPGTLILFEADLSTGLVRRAWWGPEGGTGSLITVSDSPRLAGGPETPDGIPVRSDACSLLHDGHPLDCDRVTMLATPGLRESASGRSMETWFSQRIPFPRRASLMVENSKIAWQGTAWRGGGVAREDFIGSTISMTSRVVAWGSDAVPRLRRP
jgi:hypothetical protein